MASMRVNAVFAGVLTLLVAWCVSLPAHAFVLKQTSSGATVRWARSDVVLDLDASILAIPDVERRLNAAIRLWRGSASAPRVRLGSRVSTTPKVDGRNVLFLRDGYPPVNGALGITLLSFDESTGNIVDADIVINPRYSFRTPGQMLRGAASRQYDLERVLGHEIGHLLGLDDEPDESAALMFPTTKPEHRLGSFLYADDLEGVGRLYAPKDPPAAGGCTLAAGPNGRPLPALPLTLALIALGDRRRGRQLQS